MPLPRPRPPRRRRLLAEPGAPSSRPSPSSHVVVSAARHGRRLLLPFRLGWRWRPRCGDVRRLEDDQRRLEGRRCDGPGRRRVHRRPDRSCRRLPEPASPGPASGRAGGRRLPAPGPAGAAAPAASWLGRCLRCAGSTASVRAVGCPAAPRLGVRAVGLVPPAAGLRAGWRAIALAACELPLAGRSPASPAGIAAARRLGSPLGCAAAGSPRSARRRRHCAPRIATRRLHVAGAVDGTVRTARPSRRGTDPVAAAAARRPAARLAWLRHGGRGAAGRGPNCRSRPPIRCRSSQPTRWPTQPNRPVHLFQPTHQLALCSVARSRAFGRSLPSGSRAQPTSSGRSAPRGSCSYALTGAVLAMLASPASRRVAITCPCAASRPSGRGASAVLAASAEADGGSINAQRPLSQPRHHCW